MEWKEAIKAVRKKLWTVGKSHGFQSIGQNRLQKSLGTWRALVGYETYPLKSGKTRRLSMDVRLVRSENVSEREHAKLPPGYVSPYIYYEVFSLSFPVEHQEFTYPEALLDRAAELGKAFENDWIPWFQLQSQLGPHLEGMTSYIEQVDKRLDYVP
jgi:hypothetical protein